MLHIHKWEDQGFIGGIAQSIKYDVQIAHIPVPMLISLLSLLGVEKFCVCGK
jgi:hypothetical protein